MSHTIVQSDAVAFLKSQEPDSIDLVFGSPPYELARLYLEGGQNLGVARKTDAWVAWMVDVYRAAQAACRGLVAFVVAGQTKDYRWSAGPALLAAELSRTGFNLRNPVIFHRVGIPGSGGPDWLRGDYEWIICATRPGKLPWSDNTACGHLPKWAPGGAMSYRNDEGVRKNARDKPETKKARLGRNMANGRPGSTKGSCVGRRVPAGTTINGVVQHSDVYLPPEKANPGNVVEQLYTAKEVAALLGQPNDVLSLKVGGGQMGGDEYSSQNEAPFPEKLAEFFVLSFCPPGGTVCDPFSGSGTTAAVSKRHGRNFAGCDLRESQVLLGLRRLEQEQALLFT